MQFNDVPTQQAIWKAYSREKTSRHKSRMLHPSLKLQAPCSRGFPLRPKERREKNQEWLMGIQSKHKHIA